MIFIYIFFDIINLFFDFINLFFKFFEFWKVFDFIFLSDPGIIWLWSYLDPEIFEFWNFLISFFLRFHFCCWDIWYYYLFLLILSRSWHYPTLTLSGPWHYLTLTLSDSDIMWTLTLSDPDIIWLWNYLDPEIFEFWNFFRYIFCLKYTGFFLIFISS